MTETKQRLWYLDWLRLGAAFAVAMVHVSAQNWENVDIRSLDKAVYMVFNYAMSWPVNLFVMITGALFLDPGRRIETRRLYSRHILRLVTAFLFWSGIYALRQFLLGMPLREAALEFIKGHFHMWYIPMAVSYYAMVPVLRRITEEKKLTEYFLGITFAWIFLIPGVLSFLQVFQPPLTGIVTQGVKYLHEVSNFGFYKIFIFYVVWGCWLHRYGLKNWKKWLPGLALLGYLGRLGISLWYARSYGTSEIPLDFALFDLPVGTLVFLLARDVLGKRRLSARGERWLAKLSGCTFGAYLSHALVLYTLQGLGIDTRMGPAWLTVPGISVLAFGLSLAVGYLCGKTPGIGKYIA